MALIRPRQAHYSSSRKYSISTRRPAAALDIYKLYLGDYADQLPSAGLLFPFEKLTDEGKPTGLIRTILGVDEEKKP
ncbi:hypothetical protein [Alteromonas gracilis]|uniref:hypothetical protein n=1 Tax=Alteromonas gracilis TaxID=1479524 RepID=UPI00321B53DF